MRYLAERVSPSQLSELYRCYSEIETFCLKIKVLQNPLFETTDFETIKKVQRTIEQNKIFRITRKRQINKIVDAGRHYYNYIKEGFYARITDGKIVEDRSTIDHEMLNQSPPDVEMTEAESPIATYTKTEQDERLLQKYYLDDLSDDEIKEVFSAMPAGSFTYEKADYLNQVEAKVAAYKEGQKNTQLKKLWREKTRTESPRDWSRKHKMPILCLVPDSEVAKAKAAFGAVNRPKADEQSVDRAMEYFASAKFFDLLDNAAALDKAFQSSIIGSYSVMLTDIQEVKDYLDSHITAEPFDWFGLPEIEKKLRQMAEAKYNQGGCDRALAKIDEMDIADVKKYLKDLIRDNMVVGMEIIKGD